MKTVGCVEDNKFKEMLLEELKNNFTESEITQLLISFPNEKNNLITLINKKKQEAV